MMMTSSGRKLVFGSFLTLCMILPKALPAASGCTSSQLFGVYDVQGTNLALQSALRPIASIPPTTTNAAVVGFLGNANSLSGNLAGLGRYYLDGTGVITGLTVATSTLPATNTSIGKYTVNTDCSGSMSFNSGAAYDIYLSNGGNTVQYLRTDSPAGGEVGILRRAGSCVNLNYGGSFTFQVGGSSNQTSSTGGTTGTTALAPYSAIGAFTLNGTGAFTMSESLFTSTGTARSTSSGTYTVGGDCSLSLSFNTTAGSNSTNFVAPSSLKILMVDASNGLITLQPDASTILTGTITSQAGMVNNSINNQ